MRWVQLCHSLSILWHCLFLELEWKLTFFSPVATVEFSKFARILSAALSQHYLFRIWNSSWNAKVGSQEIPGVTGKFGLGVQSETGHRLIELCQENSLIIANTLFQQREKKTLHKDVTRWSTPKSDWLYFLQPKMEKLYTVSKNKTRSWLWLRSCTPYCQFQTSIEESGENH